MRSLPTTIAVVCLALQTPSCRDEPAAPVAAAADGGHRGVVFMILDAARARDFGAWGALNDTSPHIDALGRDGVLFERAYSQASSTPRSVSSFMTGKYPPYPPDESWRRLFHTETMSTILRSKGMRTAGFSENPFIVADFGFDRGFEHFREYFKHSEFKKKGNEFPRRDSDQTVRDALDWIDEQAGQPFFAYVHLLPPHSPYDPPPPFKGKFDPDYTGDVHGSVRLLGEIGAYKIPMTHRDVTHLKLEYQENLAYGDHLVGLLVDGLRKMGRYDDTLIIVGSDHGEAFLEHGHLVHGTAVYDELIHVPLVMKFPKSLGITPKRFGGVVEMRQVLPTVLEALGWPNTQTGKSLLAAARDPETAEPGLARATSKSRIYHPPVATVIDERHKLIITHDHNGTEVVELYDLTKDPGEELRAFFLFRDEIAKLRPLLYPPAELVLETESIDIDEQRKEQLKALGYVP